MKNIFENAYFGKPYKTRDGRKAIYSHKVESGLHVLMYEKGKVYAVHSDGYYHNMECFVNPEDYILAIDIVSEYTEETNEKELDELAYRWAYNISGTHVKWELLQDAYKAGYRKAKEI